MRIKELSEKYKIDIRTIDFYSRAKILPYKEESNRNTYRNYDEKSELALKRILILRELGYSINAIKEMLYDNSTNFSAFRVKYYTKQLRSKREEELARLDQLIDFACDIQYSMKDIR